MKIKFRSWDNKSKRMFSYETLLEATCSMVHITNKELKTKGFDLEKPIPKGLFLPLYDDDLVFEQYTGINDKNGVEVYEGDKVRVFGGECHQGQYEYDFVGIIKRQFMGFDVVKNGVGQGFGYYDRDENIEVIGNIHET